MSQPEILGLPSPSDDPTPGQGDQQKPKSSTGRSHERPIRSLEQCKRALDGLISAVAIGLMTPNQANVMRGILKDLIAVQQPSPGASATSAQTNKGLLEQLRQNPQLANLLEPYLPSELIALLTGGETYGPVK